MAEAKDPFEGLIPIDEFVHIAAKCLHRSTIQKRTLYVWIRQGMPAEKIRGRIFIPEEKAKLWIRRS